MTPGSKTYQARFSGIKTLLGNDTYAAVARSSVCVVGLGGVGSWVVEALARSGVGGITLVDFDDICISNINRQLHALESTIGKSKASLLEDRIHQIHPECVVTKYNIPFSKKSAERILSAGYDVVIDAIDRVTNKAVLISECISRKIPVVVTGAAGERSHPRSIVVEDLALTKHDQLLSFVRKKLRQEFGFTRIKGKKFRIPAVYAPMQRNTREVTSSLCLEVDQETVEGASIARSCSTGLGTAVYVTGTFGFFAAAEAIKIIESKCK